MEGGAAVDFIDASHEGKDSGDSEKIFHCMCCLVGNPTMRVGAITCCGRVGCCGCPCMVLCLVYDGTLIFGWAFVLWLPVQGVVFGVRLHPNIW